MKIFYIKIKIYTTTQIQPNFPTQNTQQYRQQKKNIQAFTVLIFYEIVAGLIILLVLQFSFVIYLLAKKPFRITVDQLHIIITEFIVAVSIMFFLNLIKDEKEEETSRFHFTYAHIYLFIVCQIIHDFHLLVELIEYIAIKLKPYLCTGRKLYIISNIRSQKINPSTIKSERRKKEQYTEEDVLQLQESQFITYETERKVHKPQIISKFAKNNNYNLQNLPLKSRFSPMTKPQQSPQSQMQESYNYQDSFQLDQTPKYIRNTRQKNNTIIGYPQQQTQPQESNQFKQYIKKKKTYLQQNYLDQQQQEPNSPSHFSNYSLNRRQQQSLQDSQYQQALTPQSRIRQKNYSDSSFVSENNYQQQQLLQQSPKLNQYSPSQNFLIENNYTNDYVNTNNNYIYENSCYKYKNNYNNSNSNYGSVKHSRRKYKINTLQPTYQL
ncbi:hypothetical protein PPERSA_11024 [Pseudocohnilembus persalinus]|uniref:Transmembrane protein n=1 Tax=Pseudocohnilembus persalinus TaxID=266149 RepID=A0A0V0QYV1_PSEPJ|nr:hypothetical protein PPERSA_11024 [Pseudocohnilembus persalinus]|eukprot:KRX07475.1 hypothetical protein PPERSA_11024 [Pseudocohnilembus persalinus]